MKVLMISGDPKLLDERSSAGERARLQRSKVDQLDIFVWPQSHTLRAIKKALHVHRHEVITTQDPLWRGLLGWFLSRAHTVRLNVQVHGDLSALSRVKRALAHFVLRRAHSVRAVSTRVAEQVARTGTKAQVHVLPMYLDLERFTKVTPIAHERPTILWIGRFEKEKDPLRAIAVLREVRAHGSDAVLVMLGAGSLAEKLQSAAHELPVEFPGWKAPEEYLPYADVVLSTSPAESWGASIIESLAAGVPVVAPDVGVAREAGAIIEDRAHLARAVFAVLRDRPRGVLKIAFLDREAWATKWKESLL